MISASATMFNIWSRIYTGPEQYHEDRGLTMFTTYEYRVTSFNSRGQVTSDASVPVTTFGGTPSKPAIVVASAINHTTITVSWQTPSKYHQSHGKPLSSVPLEHHHCFMANPQ